jgi:TolC family type I secretion outer membrane protein
MSKGTIRGLLVLFSASVLIGASWSPLRAPYGTSYSTTNRFGSPVVYVALPGFEPDYVSIPRLRHNIAIRSDETEPARQANTMARPQPSLKNLRFGSHKGYERLVFDFSDRLDFWYWTMPHQDTLTIEFPSLQTIDKKLQRNSRFKFITATKFAANNNGKGGRFVVGLADNSRLKRIFLLPPGKSGGHRLVVDISGREPRLPPARGTGMAWGGGKEIDNIGPVMLAKLYGDPSITLAAKDVSESRPARSEPEQEIRMTPLRLTPAAAKNVSFDPVWPKAVDSETNLRMAEQLSNSLKELLETHERIRAARADLEAARQTMMATKKSRGPTLDVTAFYGYEHHNKPSGSEDTHMPPREVDVSVTQLVSNFGAMHAEEEQAELSVAQAEAVVKATVQAVMLEGLSAHYQLAGARQTLRYARLSEQNIKRQAELENARVVRGSGLATDVLQAKAQLAGASARRVRAEGAFATVQHRYLAVFGALPADQVRILALPVPTAKLPKTLAAGVDVALAQSPQLEIGRLLSEIARAETRRLKSTGYYPELNLIAEAKWKQDVAGTVGSQQEQIIRLELTFPFNMGGAAVDTVNASKQVYLASSQRLVDAKSLVRERVESAWQQFKTAEISVQQLRTQADLAAEFLGLARKERKLGKRSLIEVLSGETVLANARSDAVTAQNDLALAAWTLLSAMGTLGADSVL